MKTEIIKIKGDWQEVVDDCRATVSKKPLGKEPSEAFKVGILIAEHSPIRDLIVKWRWMGIPHWVGVHWVRHKWEKFVSTQRSDRTGIDRTKLPQDEPQNFTGEANAQHLIDTFRKRLCFTASKETREYAEDFKLTLHDTEPELSDVLVPNCVYRFGCPEMDGCDKWKKFVLWCVFEKDAQVAYLPIKERYALYNEWFRSCRKDESHEAHKRAETGDQDEAG